MPAALTMDRISELLGYVHQKGVRLWSDNGQLRYRAPEGALTQEEMESLKLAREQIVALLERYAGMGGAEARLEPRQRRNHVPVSFSQLAHWNLYRLSERSSTSLVWFATHWRGRLNIDALRRSVMEIVRRHDALRTRIAVHDGLPMQEINEAGGCELRVHDLSALSDSSRETAVRRFLEQDTQQSISVTTAPLFGIRLLRLCDDECVLIGVMEHMISDGFSRNILLRDLIAAYLQAAQGRVFSLPTIPIQFADFALWQRDAQSSWLKRHGAYWRERVKGCRRVRFPADRSSPDATDLRGAVVRFEIGADLKTALSEWARLKRTTLVMTIFTAYVGLVLRWCDVSEAVFPYESDGRVSSNMKDTIGYFASPLYLRMELLESDNFVDLMRRITEEYCNAYEHADYSYMEAQTPRPGFTRNSCFNWIPQGLKIEPPDPRGLGDTITCSVIRFEPRILPDFERDTEPMLCLLEADDRIECSVKFALNRFDIDTMERFGRNLLVFLRVLLSRPGERVKDVLLLQ
jgi:hypothetical protein